AGRAPIRSARDLPGQPRGLACALSRPRAVMLDGHLVRGPPGTRYAPRHLRDPANRHGLGSPGYLVGGKNEVAEGCYTVRQEAAMSHKQVLFSPGAREKVLKGASALADAVRVTLGPKSKCVLVEKKWGRPLVCDDGVTIAKEIELKDPEENLGARMIREAAEKTGDAVGDGTSTSTLLAHAIYAEGRSEERRV